MNAQKTVVATLLGTVVTFFTGWLLYGMVFSGFFAENYTTNAGRPDEEMIWWGLVAGNFFYAYLLTFLLSRIPGANSFSGGLKFGASIGLIFGFAMNLTMHGSADVMTLTGVLVDPFVNALFLGIPGGVIGWWLGRD